MLASKNLLKPADGEPIISPSKDMVLGIYYLTMELGQNHPGDGRAFYDYDEVKYCYDVNQVNLHTKIKFKATTYSDEDGQKEKKGRCFDMYPLFRVLLQIRPDHIYCHRFQRFDASCHLPPDSVLLFYQPVPRFYFAS